MLLECSPFSVELLFLILSTILNVSLNQMDSKIPLPCRTHLFKVVHISLKYLHTSFFGSKWPDIPDSHCKFKQTKQNSYQPGDSWEPSWNQYHVNDRCCFLGGERPTWYTATWQGFFIFLMGTKCIQVLLTGTKDTEENWEGRKGKCQTHCWGSATESSWVWYWFQQNILQMIPLPTPRVTPSKVSIWQSK